MKSSTGLLLVMASAFIARADGAGQAMPAHSFFVTAQRYSFEPATLEVHEGDVGPVWSVTHCVHSTHGEET